MRRLPLVGILCLLLVLPLAAQEIDFGNVQLTRTKDSSFSVTNTLPLPVSIVATKFRNLVSDFSIVSGGAPVTVQPNATHSIVIRFTPSQLGQRIDTLVITGNFPGSPVEVTLKGNGVPLPVELSAFSGSWESTGITLVWRTEAEKNNTGFSVERFSEQDFRSVGFVQGQGTRSVMTEYRFTDMGPFLQDDAVRYRLLQIDTDGSSEYSPVITVARAASFPSAFECRLAPNPAHTSSVLHVATRETGVLHVDLLDAAGRQYGVRREHELPAGSHALPLDLRAIPTGTAFVRVNDGVRSVLLRLVVAK